MHCIYRVQNAPDGEADGFNNALSLKGLKKDDKLTFGVLFESFPAALKELGPLHFRFRVSDDKHQFVWQDAVSYDQELPVHSGVVYSNVLVLSKAFERQPKSVLQLKKTAQDPTKKAPTVRVAASHQEGQVQDKTQTQTQSTPRPPPYREEERAQAKMSSSPPQASTSLEQSPVTALPTPPAPVPERDRDELAAARIAKVEERIEAARDFKQELDEQAERDAAEFDEAKAKHDGRLTEWAFQNKEKKNVRTLLTTMHTVLWDNNRWKPVGLADVIEAKKVKLSYRKAMLVVHPDRCSSRSVEVRFIAKRVFEAVNEAYQDFLKKEGLDG